MFNIGDIITGNDSNTYGKTNEFGEYKVTTVNGYKISVEVKSHVDHSLVGQEFHGLDSLQFKLLKAAPAKKVATKAHTYAAVSKTPSPSSKKYDEFDTVRVRDLVHFKSASTRTHAGSTAKILSYDEYLPYYGCWECTVSFPDGSIGVMLENEMSSYSGCSAPKNISYGHAPVDDDMWMDSPRKGNTRKRAVVEIDEDDEDDELEVVERYTYPETKRVKKNTPSKPKETRRFEDEHSDYLSTESIPKLDTSALKRRRVPKLRTDL